MVLATLQTLISAIREAKLTGSHHPPPPPTPCDRHWGWGQRCATPSQTCPRPNGFGRNLRSKTRWFTGFCNSHQVSHFATFFIDARAEISVAESHCGYKFDVAHCTCTVSGTTRERSLNYGPWRVWRRGFVVLPRAPAALAGLQVHLGVGGSWR